MKRNIKFSGLFLIYLDILVISNFFYEVLKTYIYRVSQNSCFYKVSRLLQENKVRDQELLNT